MRITSGDPIGEAIWRCGAATCGALLLGHLVAGDVGAAVGALVAATLLMGDGLRRRRASERRAIQSASHADPSRSITSGSIAESTSKPISESTSAASGRRGEGT